MNPVVLFLIMACIFMASVVPKSVSVTLAILCFLLVVGFIFVDAPTERPATLLPPVVSL